MLYVYLIVISFLIVSAKSKQCVQQDVLLLLIIEKNDVKPVLTMCRAHTLYRWLCLMTVPRVTGQAVRSYTWVRHVFLICIYEIMDSIDDSHFITYQLS